MEERDEEGGEARWPMIELDGMIFETDGKEKKKETKGKEGQTRGKKE